MIEVSLCEMFVEMLSENASSGARDEQYRDILTLLPQESVVNFITNILDLEGCSPQCPTSKYCNLSTGWCAPDSYSRGRTGQTHTRNSSPRCGGCICRASKWRTEISCLWSTKPLAVMLFHSVCSVERVHISPGVLEGMSGLVEELVN